MTLKGNYDPNTQYLAGDVVGFQGDVWCAFNDPPTGANPTNTLYWERAPKLVAISAKFGLDVLDIIGKRISEDAIALKGTGEDPADYIITVDDSGETPELVVTEAPEPETEGGD